MSFLSKSSDSKNGVANNHSSSMPLQARLRMGQTNDHYEQEADRVADQVVNAPPSPSIQQQSNNEEEMLQSKALTSPITPYLQRQAEEEPIQAQSEEEKDPLQPKLEEEPPIQTQTDEIEEETLLTKPEEEEALQAKPANNRLLQDPSIEPELNASKSDGETLAPDVRQEMETKFGSSFSPVKIHTDSRAATLNKKLHARAFTHGNHIYFSENSYAPGSTDGKRLLAHELTHVIQQTGLIQRAAHTAETPVDGTQLPTSIGRVNTNVENPDNGQISFDKVEVPGFKLEAHRGVLYGSHSPLIYHKNYTRGNTNQRDIWKQRVASLPGNKIKNKLIDKIKKAHKTTTVDESATHVFKAKISNRVSPFYIGTLDTIAKQLTTPTWGDNGEYNSFHVDHIVELQLANWKAEGSDWANTLSNMELLDGKINTDSGGFIKNKIDAKVKKFKEATKGRYGSSVSSLKNKYHIKFSQAVNGGGKSSVPSTKFWTKYQIANGDHLGPIQVASINDVNGGKDRVRVFHNQHGGTGYQFHWPGNLRSSERTWFKSPFVITEKHFNTTDDLAEDKNLGHFMVNIKAGDPNWQPFSSDRKFTIKRFEGARYAGYVEKHPVTSALEKLKLKHASPVAIDQLELSPDRGIIANGRVLTDIPIISNANIQFSIANGEFTLFKTFSIGEIAIPPPFTLNDSSLTLFASTRRGLGVEGRADFEIAQVGNGNLRAAASTSGGFELDGQFDFDSQLFDPAQVVVSYRNRVFGVSGNIGIPAGKVRGIRSATATVAYSEGNFTAEGNAELDIPGVESGTMAISHNEEGLSIGGTFNLSADIPGIRSGSISATVRKAAGEETYQLTASGTAIPDIPGISSQLSVEYDNGAITIAGSVAYSHGLLSGEINIGATNRALDSTGQPTGDPTDNFTVYGGGSLTILITPWLQGTVGVQFLPNGEIQVSGHIGLPGSIPVFNRIEIPERELYGIGFDIPIFAIPVGPKSIGLKATIRGGLRAYAGIGPGTLESLELGVEYNPARVDETRVTGQGRFVIPADAGLKLAVSATIGINALIGGVEGGLELAGGLGLEAAAEASVNVDWTPTRGLELNARLEAHVQPKLIFTIDGLIRAWFAWYEKEWRWRLADYEYGSNMRFGIALPIQYREGQPFNIAFDDLEIQRPDINARSFVQGLVRDVRNKKS